MRARTTAPTTALATALVTVALVTVALVLGLALGPAAAQEPPDAPLEPWTPPPATVPYTVQVAALSDAEAAIDLSTALLRERYPAYVVRAEGAAGAVYRVRVGAFGDRATADRYARAMGDRPGGAPRPALAEAIPAGILPLAPTRLTTLAAGEVAAVLPWGEERIAVRAGPADGLGRYAVEGADTVFDAWWAAADDEADRREVARLSLDDAALQDDDAAVREALFRQRLRLVEERSGITPETLAARAVRGEPGDRWLAAYRSVGAGGRIHGVALAEVDPTTRDADAWLGDVPPEPAAPILQVAAGDRTAEPEVSGDGWLAEPDGDWTVLESGGSRWRALVGTPLVGARDLLVVRVEGETDVIRLTER